MTAPSRRRRGRPPKNLLANTHPELADLLVDQSLRDTLSTGSSAKVLWRCPDHLDDPRHVYPAYVGNKTASKNPLRCNVCSGKHVVAGINDVATTHAEVAALMVDETLAVTRTASSNKTAEFHCGDPDHDPWTAPISRVTIQGSRCPQCAGRTAVVGVDDLATTHPELAAQLADPRQATTLKAGSGKVTWRCPVPGHPDWTATVYARTTHGTGCPSCSGRIIVAGSTDLATTHPELAAQLQDPSLATRIGKGHDGHVEWVCSADPNHIWTSSPTNRVKGVGCPICANKLILPGDNDLATTHPELAARLRDPADAKTVSIGTKTKLRWLCPVDENHEWLMAPSRFLSPQPGGCTECSKNGRSSAEAELFGIIRALLPGHDIIRNDKTALPGRRELDILIPAKGVAIEFNGVYWHSEAAIDDPAYHAEKSQLAAEAGLRLIHIWEDDWAHKRNIVIRGLAHRLGATNRLPFAIPDIDPALAQTVYARTLHVKTIQGTEARAFWRDNHIQGPVGSPYYVGLRDEEGRLRALLGVGATNHGSRAAAAPGVWDIQRYATAGAVPGGFTRLLAHATRLLEAHGEIVRTWTSFSNDDVSDGGMYVAAGFTVDKKQRPSYSYVGGRTGWRRVHRSRYTRSTFETRSDLVYEPGWTEREAARANGLLRIYDAGKTRWVKHL